MKVKGNSGRQRYNRKGHFVYSNKEIIEALQKSKGLIYVASKRLGCNPDTIRYRAHQYKEIRDAIRYERGKFLDNVENKLHQAVNRGEPWAITISLKMLGHKRGYIEKKERKVEETSTQLKVSVENKLGQWIDTLDLPLEVQEALLEAVRKKKEEMEKQVPALLVDRSNGRFAANPELLPDEIE